MEQNEKDCKWRHSRKRKCLIVQVCSQTLLDELDIAVQIKIIGEVFFHPAPPPQTWRTRRLPD